MRAQSFLPVLLSILLVGLTYAAGGTTQVTGADQVDAANPGTASAPVVCKHKAPKSECFICNPELREKGRLWCKEHERYEDRCWICHPEAQDKKRPYCNEHSLYEDECFLCHPELKKKQNKPSAGKAAPKGDT